MIIQRQLENQNEGQASEEEMDRKGASAQIRQYQSSVIIYSQY